MSSGRDVVIRVSSLDQFFNAPAINPFSENELEILGMSGLTFIMRQLQEHRPDWKTTRLLVRLPPDQITPGLEPRLAEALHRYCHAKIEDNKLEIHLIRVRSAIGLGILAVIVVALIAGTYLLFTDLLTGVSRTIQAVIAAAISLFAWVSLWDPLEALLFNPIALLREDAMLRKISELKIVVEPDGPDTRLGGADALVSAEPQD